MTKDWLGKPQGKVVVKNWLGTAKTASLCTTAIVNCQ